MPFQVPTRKTQIFHYSVLPAAMKIKICFAWNVLSIKLLSFFYYLVNSYYNDWLKS